MIMRGIISPTRSRSSPRPNRSLHNNNNIDAASNPSKHRNHKKDNPSSNIVKTSAPAPAPAKTNTSTIPPSKPTTRIVPSPQLSKPKDILHTDQKKDKTSHAAVINSNSRLLQPSRRSRQDQDQGPNTVHVPLKFRRSITDCDVPGIEPSSKNAAVKVKGAVAFGSKSDLIAGSAVLVKGKANKYPSKKQVVNNYDGGGIITSRSDPGIQNQINTMLGCGLLDDISFGNPDPVDDQDLANIVVNANASNESGSDIKKTCSQNDAPRIFEIYKDIASHHQGTQSITCYYTKLKTFCNELASYNDLPHCSCGAMERPEKVMQFLMGLNESYHTFCLQILLMEPFPTVEKAYSLILKEEKRRELVLSLEVMAEKLRVHQNEQENQSLSTDDDHMLASACNSDIDKVFSFSNEPLLIDLGSPVRC